MDALTGLVSRLEACAMTLESLYGNKNNKGSSSAAGASTSSGAGGAMSPAVAAYGQALDGLLDSYLSLSAGIGGLVQEQSSLVKVAFQAQRDLIATASAAKKPAMPALQELIAPLQKAMGSISELRDKNRPSPLFNHLSVVSEGIPALGWVVVELTPVPYVGEMKEAAQFYVNRVIKEYRDKDKAHVEWAQSYTAILGELQGYVKAHHTTGLTWNPRGEDAKAVAASSKAAPSVASAATPASTAKPSASAFLSGLGDNVTAGLRKVDKSEMTHKNPELRASSVVKADAVPEVKAAPKVAAAAPPKAPPKLALEGNKWVVENYVNDSNIIIDKTELRQTVYIYNCTNSTIQVKGKVNAVTIDGSKKCGLLVENVVSTLDVVNCKSTTVQITGKAPTMAVDKSDGLQVYLSKDCLDIEVFTAKSSALNVLYPNGEDYVELPVPEQLKTTLAGGKLASVAVEHKG